MSIEDNKWSEELLDDHFGEMRILLTETCESFVKTDWFSKYQKLNVDTVQGFEIMEDEVQRLHKCILLHDALVRIPSEELLELIEKYDIEYEE